jgi:DnaJ like chaperone protein
VNKIWGKVMGGVLGLAIGGPVGAVVGFAIGHVHDTRRDNNNESPWADLSSSYATFNGTAQQSVFTMGVIVLGAKMAKADGRVTPAEIAAFKRVFQVLPTQQAKVGQLFDRARQSAEGFEPYAFQLAQTFRNNPVVLEEILTGLFIIAAADSAGLSHAETRFLKSVAFIFNFDAKDFARIAARSGVKLPLGDEQKQQKASNESFAILGVNESASADEIKAAYRALIIQHHPDKLVAQGMPSEFIETANEKMKRINAAYDTVCRMKGIK